jgi:hypothetical protein
MWYLIKRVVWTKDILDEQNWEGNLKYSFCSNLETIHHHLFFSCCYARFIWRLLYYKFGIRPPTYECE